MSTKLTGRLESLQVLRFLAAFIVIFAHAELYEFRTVNVQGGMLALGAYGVDIFFVISGFVMVHVTRTSDVGLRPAVSFFVRRVARVVPLYLIFTVATVAIAYLCYQFPFAHNESVNQYFGPQKFVPEFVLRSITFTHWGVAPVVTFGWTLQIEFWFYFLFAVSILLRLNTYAFFIVCLGVVLSRDALGLRSYELLYTIFNPYVIEFVLGVLLYPAAILTRRLHGTVWFTLGLPVLAAFFVLCNFDPFWAGHVSEAYRHQIFAGLASFCLVLFFVQAEGGFKPSRVLVFLGDASYSIYLGHWLCATILPFIFWKAGWFPEGSVAIYVLAIVIISTAFGALVHVWLEKPLGRLTGPLVRRIDGILQRGARSASHAG